MKTELFLTLPAPYGRCTWVLGAPTMTAASGEEIVLGADEDIGQTTHTLATIISMMDKIEELSQHKANEDIIDALNGVHDSLSERLEEIMYYTIKGVV